MTNEILLRIGSTPLCPGQLWDNRFIRAVLISHLVVPTLHIRIPRKVMPAHIRSEYQEREQVREVFTTEVALRLARAPQRSKKASSARRRFPPLARFNADRVQRLLTALPANHYLPEWGSEAKVSAASPLRDIFTVGLFVLILDDLQQQNTNVKIADAKEALHARYKTGQLWVTNTYDFPKVWGRLKPVAHLAAAVVRLLHEAKALKRSRKALTIWGQKMPRFLSLAKYYEELLIERKLAKRTSFDRHKAKFRAYRPVTLLKPQQLWRLPPLANVAKVKCLPALPPNDRKRMQKKST